MPCPAGKSSDANSYGRGESVCEFLHAVMVIVDEIVHVRMGRIERLRKGSISQESCVLIDAHDDGLLMRCIDQRWLPVESDQKESDSMRCWWMD